MDFPRLYPIVDIDCFAQEADPLEKTVRLAESLLAAGAKILQLRDKSGDLCRFLSCARELQRITRDRARLIVNDRADIALAAQADGVHLGQDDPGPAAIRPVFDAVGAGDKDRHLWIGFSTHNLDQVKLAGSMPVDYIAIGPVFATSSKANPDPVVGLEGIRLARQATTKPLVAIGGITRRNCRQVRDAGADSVAVISDLLESPVKAVEEFLSVLR